MKKIIFGIVLFFTAVNICFAGSVQIAIQKREEFNKNGFLSLRRVDGEIAGYVVKKSKNDIYLSRADLQEGDLVVKINGYDLTNPKHLKNSYRELKDSNRIEFIYFRSDETSHRVAIVEFIENK